MGIEVLRTLRKRNKGVEKKNCRQKVQEKQMERVKKKTSFSLLRSRFFVRVIGELGQVSKRYTFVILSDSFCR